MFKMDLSAVTALSTSSGEDEGAGVSEEVRRGDDRTGNTRHRHGKHGRVAHGHLKAGRGAAWRVEACFTSSLSHSNSPSGWRSLVPCLSCGR